ncbi:MAG: helix-turn-helix domain-containing protein [Clostridium baratii]|uniref:phBC6A51 family helix-turn-helix protein n=1 Tax=Clostridium baratii TaxID=1561 RepID=UPI002431BC46|nr:phBC6A51 family helix-turn-helix protein [Clostridium baratii]MBS6006893.1 helix-turn-helix domain-containing protein [Clostridium baratii]MDU1053431.1 phBC6A51 family helix-turn-helix protein [Clostridium baratii]
MIINDKHILCMQKLLEGQNKSKIAKSLKVSRQTIYDWLEEKEFIIEMDRLRQQTISQAENKLNGKVELYLDKLEALALDEDTSEKVRADVLKYLVNRTLGNTTVKTELAVKDDDAAEETLDMEEFKLELIKDAK